MSFVHSPEGKVAWPVLQAVAKAIKALEVPEGRLRQYEIGREDDEAYNRAKRSLWGILESNDCTIDCDTDRLTKRKD